MRHDRRFAELTCWWMRLGWLGVAVLVGCGDDRSFDVAPEPTGLDRDAFCATAADLISADHHTTIFRAAAYDDLRLDAIERLRTSAAKLASMAAQAELTGADEIASVAQATTLLDAEVDRTEPPPGALALDALIRSTCMERLTGLGILGDPAGLFAVREQQRIDLGSSLCDVVRTLVHLDHHAMTHGEWGTGYDEHRESDLVMLRFALDELVQFGESFRFIDQDPTEFYAFGLATGALAPGTLNVTQRETVAILTAEFDRLCGVALAADGLLSAVDGAAAISPSPLADQPPPVGMPPVADFCATAESLFLHNAAFATAEPYSFEGHNSVARQIRAALGRLRLAAHRSLGDIDPIAIDQATNTLENAQLRESGALAPDETAAAEAISQMIRSECGFGLSASGLLTGQGA